jgi:glycosyltransferase involved in cell wall biosynthesis
MSNGVMEHRTVSEDGQRSAQGLCNSRAGRRPPIRILEFRAADGAGGGPEKTILYGTASTDPGRFAITVCYIRDVRDGQFDIHDRAQAFEVDYVQIQQRHGLDPSVWGATRTLVRRRRIDIVHSHDYKTDLLALLLARSDGIIPLATAHGWSGNGLRERLLYYPIDKRLLAMFPRVIAVSSDIRQVLLQCGARPDRVQTVLNGIDHLLFRRRREREADVRNKLGLDAQETVIGGIGRLAPEKRFDVLLEAFTTLTNNRPQLRLVLAGDGPAREGLKAKANQLGVASKCRFLGHYSNIIELHHALDVLVQSSTNEGTPNVVLEAMAMETPIVATDAGGTTEIAQDGVHALIVPPRDPWSLAGAVERTLDNRGDTARRVRAARKRVEEELSFDVRMQTVEAIYEELMATRVRQAMAK